VKVVIKMNLLANNALMGMFFGISAAAFWQITKLAHNTADVLSLI